jgi:predicted metalloprotease
MTGRAAMLAILAAVVVACGDQQDGDATPEATTATATATATASADPVDRMPEAPSGDEGSLSAPRSTKVHDAGLLHEAHESAERLWNAQFQAAGARYQHAKLAFFHTTVRTGCGEASKETGPFYCPADHGVYLNTAFFDGLARAYGLSSGFAAGYVVGHEIGHHVQELLGTLRAVAAADARDPSAENARSIKLELQADCYSGVWLHSVSAAGQLGEADLRDILTAAAVVGDDFQRNQAGTELAPETWTHGSSAQRVHWLSVGLETGRPAACDTFSS